MAATLGLPHAREGDSLAVRFLKGGAQPAGEVAGQIADFIAAARRTLLLAIYDCRLEPGTAEPIQSALQAAIARGVDVRLVYDNSGAKPQSSSQFERNGGDLTEPGMHERVSELGLPPDRLRAINGPGLMHHKYMVRDDAAIWTGSMNWSDDSMTRMENTILALESAPLAAYVAQDFEQLWESGLTINSGRFRTTPATIRFGGAAATADIDFSPGQGEHINATIARRVSRARHRIIFCSMLINSSKLLAALMDVIENHDLELWGVYDRTQMDGVLHQWQGQPQLQWKIDAVQTLLRRAEMIGKHSLPYRPGRSHNFMHNKMLIVDDTVIAGSYNLSHAAEANAENMMAIESPALAAEAMAYVTDLRNAFLAEHSRPPRRDAR